MAKMKLILFVMCASLSLSCKSVEHLSGKAPEAPTLRETGRDFLTPPNGEKPGYGLYSYILFGTQPTPKTRDRYIEVIEAFLRLPKIADLQRDHASCGLNITYLPMLESPQSDSAADWFLAHYDYARARTLLGTLPGSHRLGPYIVSTYKPLGGVQRLTGPYLYQDLSSTPPEIVVLWMNEFLTRVEQDRFWEERTAMQFVIDLRESIAIAAKGFPEVRDAVKQLVSWNK